jgi:hypothetical protein
MLAEDCIIETSGHTSLGNGVTFMQQDREDSQSQRFGPHRCKENMMRRCHVIMRNGAKNGIWSDPGGSRIPDPAYTDNIVDGVACFKAAHPLSNNQYIENTYECDPTLTRWRYDGDKTFAQWQAAGRDTSAASYAVLPGPTTGLLAYRKVTENPGENNEVIRWKMIKLLRRTASGTWRMARIRRRNSSGQWVPSENPPTAPSSPVPGD